MSSTPFSISRRELLLGGGASLAAFAGGSAIGLRANAADFTLPINSFDHPVMRGKPTAGMMGFGAGGPAPVLRMKQGEVFKVDVENRLEEASIVHWHGLRIDNAMDGVPYLTQNPIAPGELFRYQFTPPDAGTFWFHPHCNTLEQMARGLTGMMIVEEPEEPGFDQDIPLNIRDFRLGGDGQFTEFFKPRLAARGGTLGTVSTVNWQTDPVYEIGSGLLVRLRLAVTDLTRVGSYSISGGQAQVIALDSNPLPAQLSMPATDIVLSPGQRADVALLMPDQEGREVTLTRRTAKGPKVLARFRATGPSAHRDMRDLKPLVPNPVAEPDLANAQVEEFVFGWTPEGVPPVQSICGTLGYTFWSINRQAWQGDTPDPIAPLAVLRQGRSYILRLRNETPNAHPIHLHGMTFKLLRSNKRQLPPLFTDTALLLEEETMDVALVADNPGDWAFHCHVIEHQKTGLTGYIRVIA